MRVGIIALLHESNTFLSSPTSWEHFQQDKLLLGEEVRRDMGKTHHEVSGFFAGLEEAHQSDPEQPIEAVPIFAARAVPFGTITAETYERLLEQLFQQLSAAQPLDGLLLAPHGATVSEAHPDADGYWLTKLRETVGTEMPCIATLDPHGNLSTAMVDACDAIIAYRSNPHLDQQQRGREAALLMAATLRGEVQPTMAASLPPMAINIERQFSEQPPCKPLYELADQQLTDEKVLSNSIMLGFPYSDVEEMGSAVIVVTNNDPQLAAQRAIELGTYLWQNRDDFVGQLAGIDEVLTQVAGQPGPICLLDMGDNVGGGSPADGTHLLHALHRHGLTNSLVCLYDPAGVEQAAQVKAGETIELSVGGHSDEQHGEPFLSQFSVLGMYDGKFTEPEPRHGGNTECDQGPTTVLRSSEGLTIMLTSRRMPPFSLHQLTSCQIDPTQFHILVAKGVNAPVAAYREVCDTLIRVNTPGSTTADMLLLDYQHRRQPMFPFERETDWLPTAHPSP
ncbi:MAG: M81 family metallopeptidase [Pirellulaceae bacterium]